MRMIDADAANVEDVVCFYGDSCRIECVKEWLDEQPTIEAEPVRHGRWKLIGADKRGRGGTFECTACNGCYPYKCKYCPNCGAKMRSNADE